MESLQVKARALHLRRFDDQVIADRTLTGDPSAFFELHRRYRKRIVSACAGILSSQTTAEDAAQETFLRVLRAAPQQIENVEAWLLTIARNVCIDITRRASRVETPADVDDFQTALPVADSATELMRRDNARQVFLALRRLPTRYRTALTLREFHGMSSTEIEESMSVSVKAVDSIVSRARDAFGSAYAEASGFPRACREAVERVYRELGSGIDEAERAQLMAHIAECPRCRAEYRRAHSSRYVRGLLPFLVTKFPSLNLVADAVVRSSEAPAVMQSIPALTAATAVATLSAAVVLSPIAMSHSGRSKPAEPAQAIVATAPERAHEDSVAGVDGAAISRQQTEADVVAVAVAETATASTDAVTVALGPSDAGADSSEAHPGTSSGSSGSGDASKKPGGGSAGGDAADGSGSKDTPSEGGSGSGSSDGDKPTPADPPATVEEPAGEPEPTGWGDLPDGAVLQDTESVSTGAN